MVKRLVDERRRAGLRLGALVKKEMERMAIERLEARGAVQREPDGTITIKAAQAAKEAENGGRGL